MSYSRRHSERDRSQVACALHTVGTLLASSFLGMFIGAAALGRLADRIGRRRAFLFNLIWFSLWTKAWTPRDTALGDDGRMPILVEPTIVAEVWSSIDQPSIHGV